MIKQQARRITRSRRVTRLVWSCLYVMLMWLWQWHLWQWLCHVEWKHWQNCVIIQDTSIHLRNQWVNHVKLFHITDYYVLSLPVDAAITCIWLSAIGYLKKHFHQQVILQYWKLNSHWLKARLPERIGKRFDRSFRNEEKDNPALFKYEKLQVYRDD